MKFGTDGIRGIVNKDLDVFKCAMIARGIAINLLKSGKVKRVIIGRDTRSSGCAYAMAIASVLMDYGIDVVDVGIVSTPLISFAISRGDFDGGVMITASHNDISYNGIKVFNDVGEKISTIDERNIEKYQNMLGRKTATKGKLIFDDNIVKEYIQYLENKFYSDMSGLTIVIDSANGSNSHIAPIIYKSMHANVIPIACTGDGNNINNKCGSNHIETLQKEVLSHHADFGIAFDGDGDRLRIVLSNGDIMSGDDILLYFALYLKEHYMLNNLTVVGTIMSSMGLEDELTKNKIRLIRTDVGDKNVIQMLKEKSLSIGGESSGHICVYSHNPTCDALLNSLFFFKCLIENNVSQNNIFNVSKRYFSITKNISVDKKIRESFDKNSSLKNEIEKLKTQYPNTNIVVRPSGTEPVIRIYIESNSNENNKNIYEKLLNLLIK